MNAQDAAAERIKQWVATTLKGIRAGLEEAGYETDSEGVTITFPVKSDTKHHPYIEHAQITLYANPLPGQNSNSVTE